MFKRLVVIVSVFVLCTLITVGALLLALRSSRVQTAVVAIVTEEMSRIFHVETHIDKVEIRPPLSLYMKGAYLSDQNRDTLLFIPEMKVRFNPFALEKNNLSFPLVKLSNPYINIVQDSASTNMDFLLNRFQNTQSVDTFSYDIECRKIAIEGARIHYRHLPSGTDLMLSDIQTDVGFRFSGRDSIAAALRALYFRARVPSIDGYAEADLHGSLDTLFADKLCVVYQGQQMFLGDVQVNKPLVYDSLSARLSCTDIYVNAPLLSSLLSDVLKQPFEMPSEIVRMGNMHYRGQVECKKDNLHLHGAFVTRMGTISTTADMLHWDTLRAAVSTSNWALGRMLHNSELGSLAASLKVRTVLSDMQTNTYVDGLVSRLTYHGYPYSNIRLHGHADSTLMEVSLDVKDPNVNITVNSLLNVADCPYSLDAHADVPFMQLDKLQLTDSALGHSLSFQAGIHLTCDSLTGSVVDEMNGLAWVDSLWISGAKKRLLVPTVDVQLQQDEQAKSLTLTSSVAKANVDGSFRWTTLPLTIKRLLRKGLPSLVGQSVVEHKENNINFSLEVLQPNQLLDVIMPNNMDILDTPMINGYLHESDSAYFLAVSVPAIHNGNTAYNNLSLIVDNNTPTQDLVAAFSVTQHIISLDSTRLRVGDIVLQAQTWARQDTLTTTFEFGTQESLDAKPDICIQTSFARVNNAPHIEMHILPTNFLLGDKRWYVEDAKLKYSGEDTCLSVNNLHIHTVDQMLSADGRLSTNMNDSVTMRFQDIDLGYLLSATQIVESVDIRGHVTGWGTLYGAFSTPQFEANVTMSDAYINETRVGSIVANATLDRTTGNVLLDGAADLDGTRIAGLTGQVVTSKPVYWELFIDANGAPLSFINRWTQGIIDGIDGRGYGHIHLFGSNLQTWVTARAFAKDATLTIPYTGCRYFFSDSVILDTTYVSFPAIHLRDAEGHQGVVSGMLTHTQFENIQYHIGLKCRDLMAIDLQSDPQRMYYGRAYATGMVDIQGDEQNTRIDVNASTAGNTDFYLSLATASDASETDFITFRQPASDTLSADEQKTKKAASSSMSHIWLNLAIEALSSARVHLMLDSHNGDGIVGRGEGNLRLSMDASTGNLQLLGVYSLLSGTFSYTVGNLIHRDFVIQEGSTVTWSGNPEEPQLDITAKYRCTASLRDLFGAEVKSITSRSSIPVDCVIRIMGGLNDMQMKFGIEFPQSDESVAAQINAVINTEAMLMRQVIYLLIFNRFYTPDYMRTENASTGVNDAYSLLSSTVTGQINSWLSKLTSMVNVGFNLRSDGTQGNQSYETEANIQIQPINRLTINGNVGYRYNDISNQPFFGDADIEYELTPDGKLRAKVFTHSVDKYSLHQSGMQEGVGFVFRHDFNPGDAKKRREQRKK
ncbi:MAG: translocation/assembly module TamB [Paludibacteraceae bacterium]|nr:translocation/assembly module TamB [Paludibacteraceae bacterium]